jgi:hypothetical protein
VTTEAARAIAAYVAILLADLRAAAIASLPCVGTAGDVFSVAGSLAICAAAIIVSWVEIFFVVNILY